MAFLLLTSMFASFLVGVLSCGCGPQLPQDPFDPLGAWHQRHIECGIPPFAYRLPQDAQSKIHSIWIKYEAGDDCVLKSLVKNNCGQPTNVKYFRIPEQDRIQAFKGMCGPGFLKNESNEVREEFQKVWFDENLSIDQKQAEFKRIAALRLKGNAKTKFDNFDKVLEEHKKERQQIVDAMSAPARDAYKKWKDMRKEERVFLASLPAEIRAELGLVCKCCGGCKTGKPRAARSAPLKSFAAAELEGALKKSDSHILHQASESECLYLY